MLFLLSACTIETTSFVAPEPTLIFISPTVAAPGQRVLLVGQNFELTPEDPNDVPGTDRPTPYSIQVFINEQPIPFQPGDLISASFLTIHLPTLEPGAYQARVEVEGQSTGLLFITVDTITSIQVSQDPLILSGVGESILLTVFGNRFDQEQVDITDDVSFEVTPPGALAIGFSHFMVGLQHGDAVLTARRGLLSDSVTVTIEGDDHVASLLAPETLTVPVGESAILELDGLTELGSTVALESATTIQISGDEAAMPVTRNELGQPVLQALAPGIATFTFTLGDGSLGQAQTTVTVP